MLIPNSTYFVAISLVMLLSVNPEYLFTFAEGEGAIRLQSPYRQYVGGNNNNNSLQRGKGRKRSSKKKHHNYYERKTVTMKDHGVVNGEYVETSRILVQKGSDRGVEYYPYGEMRLPVFIRKAREMNKKYIVFQDPYLPPGEGYLVVLKRIPPRTNGNGIMPPPSRQWMPSQVSYEAFHMLLSNNVHGSVDRLNVRRLAYRIRTRFAGRKNARNRFAQRRRKLAHARRRFSLGKWRGKRSAPQMPGKKVRPRQYLTNRTVLFKAKNMKLAKLGAGGARERGLARCTMTLLNMTALRLKLQMLRKSEPPTYNNLPIQENEDFYDFLDD